MISFTDLGDNRNAIASARCLQCFGKFLCVFFDDMIDEFS